MQLLIILLFLQPVQEAYHSHQAGAIVVFLVVQTTNKNSPILIFHAFPVDPEMRTQWVRAIRRDEGPNFKILRGSTFVCSKHFNLEDLYTLPSGRIRVKPGAVPSRFRWNDWDGHFHECQEYQRHYIQGRGLQVRESVCKRARKLLRIAVLDDSQDKVVPKKEAAAALILWSVAKDHDYVQNSSPVKLEHAAQRIQELDLQVPLVKSETKEAAIDFQVLCHK